MKTALFAALSVATTFLFAADASAFCGFYVSGSGEELHNDATVVVLMREGTRTVLSMQNAYEGPPEDFAMVVPVPVILEEDDVRTLEDDVFERVTQMAAPRLVEYWEQDPCGEPQWGIMGSTGIGFGAGGMAVMQSANGRGAVVIEAEFTVGEYDVVVLSADEAGALDTWLRANDYAIPDGAEELLRPYVQGGMYFFVAKVNIDRVEIEDGRALLSPLRFHYDSQEFSLPIRLGLINAPDAQDLLVHVLGRNQRYEVANYENVTIPTNIEVDASVVDSFGEFYAALFDATLQENPGAVVTEYAWDASTCDPCPGPNLTPTDFRTLGADVLPGATGASGRGGVGGGFGGGFVLTRMHARYDSESLGEDLVFREAIPIAGGREVYGPGGLEESASRAPFNNFQGRYIVRHPWEGDAECDYPAYGQWGGPPGGQTPTPRAATDVATVDRTAVSLASTIRQDVPEISFYASIGGAAEPGPIDEALTVEADSEPPPREPAPAQAAPAPPVPDVESGGRCAAAGAAPFAGILIPLVFSRRRERSRGNDVGSNRPRTSTP